MRLLLALFLAGCTPTTVVPSPAESVPQNDPGTDVCDALCIAISRLHCDGTETKLDLSCMWICQDLIPSEAITAGACVRAAPSCKAADDCFGE